MEKGGIPFLYDTGMERVNETRIFSHIAQNSLSASASPAAAREAIKLQSSGVLRNSPQEVGRSLRIIPRGLDELLWALVCRTRLSVPQTQAAAK